MSKIFILLLLLLLLLLFAIAIAIIAVQPFAGSLPLFQFLNPVHSR
jgi:hypothetical protein